jgi:Ca-activated chloride channel family protein
LGNFEFLYPQFLLIFAIPLFVLIYILTTKKRIEQNFFTPEILEKLTSSNGGLSTKLRTYLSLFALLFMVVALARPVQFDKSVDVESKSVDVVIALDISKSMLAKDLYPNRLEFSKHKVIQLLEKLKKNRVGVVAFAQNSYTVSPLTFDKEGVSYLVKNLKTENITQQGTSFKNLLLSVDMFLKDNKDRVLLIFSDGGDSMNYADEVKIARESGMKVFILGVGSETGSPIQLQNGQYLKDGSGNIVVSKFNSNIKDLAFETGGIFLSGVNSDKDISAILNEISGIESETTKEDTLRSYKEYFVFPLIFALILLFPTLFSIPKFKKIFPLSLILFFPLETRAGVFDWFYLDTAESSFNSGNYDDARKNWEKINIGEAVNFNIGNSYFKEEKYKEAIEYFQKISGELKQNALYNIGNSFVKMDKLYEALNSYQKALELGEKANIRENLEWVKKQLEKQNENENSAEQPPNQNDRKDNSEENKENQDSKNENSENKQNPKQKNDEAKSENETETGEKKSENPHQKGESEESESEESDQNGSHESEEKSVIENNSSEGEKNNSQIREATQSDFKEMKELEERREEFKILQMLNNRLGGTKIYSIPIEGGENQRSDSPW